MMSLYNPPKWFVDFFMMFSARIDVEVNLDSFTFIKGHEFKKFNTFIYVSKDATKPRIISVGETPIKKNGAFKISIFEEGDKDAISYDKYDCLSAFLAHCLKAITSRSAMVRPSIYIKGAKKLDPILNGFQNRVLIDSFGDAGAARVIMND